MIMRKLTDHIVNPVNDLLTVTVIDGTGPGGAPHEYEIAPPMGARTRLSFQNGPINEVGVNGITHEALLVVLIDRLEKFQAGPFPCYENAAALMHCRAALRELQDRTKNRMLRGVEGLTKA
jgi:hypothetical protein